MKRWTMRIFNTDIGQMDDGDNFTRIKLKRAGSALILIIYQSYFGWELRAIYKTEAGEIVNKRLGSNPLLINPRRFTAISYLTARETRASVSKQNTLAVGATSQSPNNRSHLSSIPQKKRLKESRTNSPPESYQRTQNHWSSQHP